MKRVRVVVSAFALAALAVSSSQAGFAIRLEKEVPHASVASLRPITASVFDSRSAVDPVAVQNFGTSDLTVSLVETIGGAPAYRVRMDFTNTETLTSGMDLWWEFSLGGDRIGTRERVPQSAWALFAAEAGTAGDADTLDGFHADQLGLELMDCAEGEILVRTAAGWECGAPTCIDGDSLICYEGPAATRSVGACREGRRFCTGGDLGASCEGQVLPAEESCNYRDDDCDGVRDNITDPSDPLAVLIYPDADGDGHGDSAASSSLACSPVPSGYSDNNLDCNDGDPLINPMIPEICDGIDNDCDGPADDSCVEGGLCSLADVYTVEQCFDADVNVIQPCAVDQGVSAECAAAVIDMWACGIINGCDFMGDSPCNQANCPAEWAAVYGTAP